MLGIRSVSYCTCALALLTGVVGVAHAAPPEAQTFVAPAGPAVAFSIPEPQALPHLALSSALSMSYARRPLIRSVHCAALPQRERFERQEADGWLSQGLREAVRSVSHRSKGSQTRRIALRKNPSGRWTEEVGAFVMNERDPRQVPMSASPRVYRHFRDIGEFMTELKDC